MNPSWADVDLAGLFDGPLLSPCFALYAPRRVQRDHLHSLALRPACQWNMAEGEGDGV
ncbi:MAG: hypothetical protein RIQ83_3830 [Pseudomonadota bacterium]|jgi:hypothetical protein